MGLSNAAHAVGFIYGADNDTRQALGTCIVASVPNGEADLGRQFYLVTAQHVVDKGRDYRAMLPGESGEAHEIKCDGWMFHPTADVAAMPVSSAALIGATAKDIPLALFGPEEEGRTVSLGQRVGFFGLLANLEQMGHLSVPVLRSGTIARLLQQNVRVKTVSQSRLLDCLLIDCRSYGGMSGGPCFVEHFAKWNDPETGALTLGDKIRLIGLITGHFDQTYELRSELTEERFEIPLNTGVGLVTPAADIADLLCGVV